MLCFEFGVASVPCFCCKTRHRRNLVTHVFVTIRQNLVHTRVGQGAKNIMKLLGSSLQWNSRTSSLASASVRSNASEVSQATVSRCGHTVSGLPRTHASNRDATMIAPSARKPGLWVSGERCGRHRTGRAPAPGPTSEAEGRCCATFRQKRPILLRPDSSGGHPRLGRGLGSRMSTDPQRRHHASSTRVLDGRGWPRPIRYPTSHQAPSCPHVADSKKFRADALRRTR